MTWKPMVLAIETERLTAGFHRYHSVTDDRGDLVYLVRDLQGDDPRQ